MGDSKHISAAAMAFNEQIRERVRHGHIPDLRRTKPCDWFYNNPWRRPYLADAVFGEIFRFAHRHIASGRRVLEVGSGPGHQTLEFARQGCHVVGIELSSACVEIAEQIARENPFLEGFGSLSYVCADFLTWEADAGSFDAVCFFGTLMFFDDLLPVLDKVERLLVPGGVLVVVEPAWEWMTEAEAAVVLLIRLLLSAGGRWCNALPVPASEDQVRRAVAEVLAEFREECASVTPSESATTFLFSNRARARADEKYSRADRLLTMLRNRFHEVEYRPGYAFAPRVVGGVRGETEEEARALAEFLLDFDRLAVSSGWMRPSRFYWTGRTR